MADTLTTVSYFSFAAAGICLATAIILFFVFKIPVVMGDLSGRNARKSIERMRKENEKTGKKSYDRLGRMDKEKGRQAEPIKDQKKTAIGGTHDGTALLKENHRTSYDGEATGLLGGTTEKLGEAGETELLEDTGLLPGNKTGGMLLEQIEEVVLIHTEETI